MTPATSYARQVIELARTRGVMIATSESCTGGLIAGALTDIAGSSAVVDRGFITYSNTAKIEMLEVEPETLQAHGAVSAQTATQMADGALMQSQASLAVSVTGIAGPGGGSPDKPVGLVWFGLAQAGKPTRVVSRRFGDVGRDRVRALTVEQALKLLIDALS